MKKKKKQIGKVVWPREIAEIESLLLARQADPEQQAWGKLIQLLNNAVVDPVIRRTQASILAQFLRSLMNEVHTASVEDFSLLFESKMAEARAKQKGLSERDWVQKEWKQHSEEYEGNKSAFARDYTKRLKNEKKYPVEPRTIIERWLKGL